MMYLAGIFYGTADFDPTAGTDERTSNGSADIFLIKLNADGSYAYAYTVGSAAQDSSTASVAVDSTGAAYLASYFWGTVDFDPTADDDSYTAGSSGRDGFLTKLNADGSYSSTAVFAAHAVQCEFGTWVYLKDVAVAPDDSIYLTGNFSCGTVDFDPTDGLDLRVSSAFFRLFVTKLKADGSYGYTYNFEGNNNDNYVYEVAVDVVGNVYLAGAFAGTTDFDPLSTTDNHTSNGSFDLFLTKLGEPAPPPSETVQICHSEGDATGPWSFLEVNVGSEHDEHTFDIIPITDLNDDGQVNIDDCGYVAPSVPPSIYLNQMVLKGSGLTLYYIEGGEKRAFSSSRVFKTWSTFANVSVVSDATLTAIPSSTIMNFRDGTLIKGSAPAVYVVEDGVKRPFKSSSVFRALGYTFERVLTVSDQELALHSSGPAITNSATIPDQTLIKGTGTTVYYTDNGKKHPFSSGNIFRTWGTTRDINIVSDAFLESIPRYPVMGFRSGSLVRAKGTPTVYYIEDGLRRAFRNQCTFDTLGFKTSNILIVSSIDILRNSSAAALDICSAL
ncbi:hypothetical protein ACFL1U_00135 [Patescibacteria group bacterium]